MAKRVKTPEYGVPKKRSNTPIILGGLALVLVLGLIAVLAAALAGGEEESEPANVAQYRTASVTGRLAPIGQDGADPAVGSPAPTVVGQTFDGSPRLIEKNGRPQVITFYAHWCPHCRAELPGISRWLQDNRSQYPNVDFHAVATGTRPSEPNFPPSRWFAKEKYPLPVLVDDQSSSVANGFGLSSYPYFVVVDKNHNLLSRTSGEIGVSGFEQLVKQAAGS